jgi:3'(2'), 5'-bisphosphate nucleotidase
MPESFSRQSLRELLDATRGLAIRAGERIVQIAREGFDVQDKSDGTPLTRADREAHGLIHDGLARLQPALGVLSEEGEHEEFESFSGKAFWLVDPLDGTKEFVGGRDEYTVNIALIELGRPILGVIYLPARRVSYFAARGLGAWRQAEAGEAEAISTSGNARPRSAVVSRSHLDEKTGAYLRRLGIEELHPCGSSMKFCFVAEGRSDLYPRFGPTCLWDTGAGAAIALEAAARVTELDGTELLFDPSRGLKQKGFLVYPASMDVPLP